MGRTQKYPSIVWVHPKSTHGCPLIWGNKYMARIIEVHDYIIDQMKILKVDNHMMTK
jgi:hypothetical protein